MPDPVFEPPSSDSVSAHVSASDQLQPCAAGHNQRAVTILAIVLLTAAGLVVYAWNMQAPFVFDDISSVVNNSSITRLWPLFGEPDHPGPLTATRFRPTSGRPLVNLSFALNYHFSGLDPRGYHAFNLVLHVLSALLLMAIVRHTLCLAYFGGRFERVSAPAALAVALLWLVHPLQTETVVYVTQRTELMVSFFYLATLYCSLRYWTADSSFGRTMSLVLGVLACFAGMACKEVMVTAPVVILLFERTFLAGSFRKALRRSWPLYFGLALSWFLLLWLNHSAPRSDSAGFQVGVRAADWWLTQSKVFWMYLKLVVWPVPLAIHYELPYLTTLSAAWPWLLLTALLCIVVLILVWRRSAIGFVGACILLILSPTFLVPISTEVAAERRMYLPLAGLAALCVLIPLAILQKAPSWLTHLTGWPALGKIAAAAGIIAVLTLAVVMGVVSVNRLSVYQTELSLWQDEVASQPDDPLGRSYLAVLLLNLGRTKQAIQQCQEILRLRPDSPDVQYNLGLASLQMGQPQEAIEYFREAIRLKPNFPRARYNLAKTFYDTGRVQDAIAEFETTLKQRSDFPEAHLNLGVALESIGRSQEAIDHYVQALDLKPEFPDAHLDLGLVLYKAGQTPQAIEHYRQALQAKPKYAEAHNNLGVALLANGQPEEAREHFQQAIDINPDYAEACANLAEAFDKLNRTPEAIVVAQMALELARSHQQTALAHRIKLWLDDHRNPQSNAQ